MDYFVRSKDGELRFRNIDDVWQGMRTGLVNIDDEVLMPGASAWRPVADLPPQGSGMWRRVNHWHVLTAALVMAVLLGGGPLVLVGIIALHGTWLVYVRKGGMRRPRMW